MTLPELPWPGCAWPGQKKFLTGLIGDGQAIGHGQTGPGFARSLCTGLPGALSMMW
jgi:hypothetical protein